MRIIITLSLTITATQLLEIRVKKDKKESPVYTTLGYVGTIKEVVELVCKDKLHKQITEGNMELKQALEFIKEQTDRIEKILKEQGCEEI